MKAFADMMSSINWSPIIIASLLAGLIWLVAYKIAQDMDEERDWR